MEITNKDLKRRIIEISYKHKLAHLGSCLTAVDIIKDIYDIKKPNEKFILSSGHAGLALYVVLEAMGGKNAEDIFSHHGVHPDYCNDCGLDCSTGSLGQGLPIALGMALADRSKNVYCLISDGELAEGSIYEANNIRFANQIYNCVLHINWNGYTAYGESGGNVKNMENLGIHVHRTMVEQLPFLQGLDAHYHVMTEDEYKEAYEAFS